MSDYNILSIDGGGMKSLISAIIIQSLELQIQKLSHNPSARIADYFDLIAGTSAGSILAGIYLCPNKHSDEKERPPYFKYTTDDAVNFLSQNGPDVFSRSFCYSLRSLYGLRTSKYQNKALQCILKQYFSDIYLSDLRKPCLFPAYNLLSGEPFFFNSASAQKKEKADFLLSDAILASCSAPTYFPPVQIHSVTGRSITMADGGLSSNNPALCAFVEAMKMPDFTTYKKVNIFSVGNVSEYTSHPYSNAKKWGLLEWAFPLLDIFLSSNTTVVDYELKMLYDSFENKTNYVRIEKKIFEENESPSLDDASEETIQKLTAMGQELVKENYAAIESFAQKLLNKKGM